MKTKLTENQQSIIENLKKEFLMINESSKIKGNLINIAELLGLKQETKDLIEEVRIFNEIEVKKRKEQILSDYNKIEGDIKALGLNCYIFSNHNDLTLYIIIVSRTLESEGIYVKQLPHNTDCISINYRSNEELSIPLPDNTGYTYKKFGITLSINNFVYSSIEKCVASDLFRNKILKYIK